MKISQKLLIMFLLTTGALVGLIFGVTQYSISTGFSSYVAQSEIMTIDELPALLSQEYKADGSWQKVFGDRSVMDRLIRENENHGWERRLPAGFSIQGQGSEFENIKDDRMPPSGPGGPPEAIENGEPPPEARGRPPGPDGSFGPGADGFYDPRPDRPGHHPPPFPPFRVQLFQRIGVFDQDGNILWGAARAKGSKAQLPIMLDGKPIGIMALAPGESLSREMESRFVEEQKQSLVAVSLVSMVLASLAAILLSRHFVEAIELLVQGTRRLIAGDLTARVDLPRADELGQLGRDLNILASTLEQHDRAHKQWITDTSHELRTPVAVLRAQVEAIQDGVQEPNARTLDVLHDEVMILGKLIDDLYDLARYDVKQFKLHKAPVDVGALLSEELEAFSERFQKKNIRLDSATLAGFRCVLPADPARLKQLFSNLLENSLRYTDEGGQLKISAMIEGKQLFVFFDDSEPGVAEELLINIFERFYRVESSRARIYGGSGLGLAICKTVAEGHGGSLRALPSALGGLRLELRLPVDVEEEEKKYG